MAFSINLISVDGYFVGPCKPMASMDNATIEGAPQESSVALGQFSFARGGYDLGLMEWNNYYLPASSQYGAMSSMVDFWDYLEVNNYSVNNPLLVCAFKVVDGQGTDTGVQLCLMAYSSSSSGNVTWQMKKRTLSQGSWTYTAISPTRTDNIYNMTGFGMMAGTVVVNGKLWYAFGFATLYANYQARAVLFGNTTQGLTQVLGGSIPGDVESPEFGPAAKPGGGYNVDSERKGTFDDTSDTITLTPFPIYDPCDAQFLKLWVMDATDLAHMSDALFPTYDLSQLDILGTWKEIAEMLLNNKRIDYVLDLLIVPVEPPHATGKQHITCGGWILSYFGNESTPEIHYVDGKLVQSSFVEVDCGSLEIEEYWANFLDFAGTKIKLFLPYIGYVDLEPEYVIGGELNVKYRFNAFDGSFMAYVTSSSGHSQLSDSLIGQFAGVAAVHIPLQSQDYTQKISGLISSMGSIAAGVASGNPASAIGAASNLSNTIMSKPGSAHANGYNASSSFLSHKRPYLIIERQASQFSEKYPEEVGLPLYMSGILGSFSGLTKCQAAHLDTIPCTVEGKEKISRLMAEGIIL